MWEDDKNKRGGRWLINLDKKQRQNSLDNFWLEVMLCLIGESFDDHSQYVSTTIYKSVSMDVSYKAENISHKRLCKNMIIER